MKLEEVEKAAKIKSRLLDIVNKVREIEIYFETLPSLFISAHSVSSDRPILEVNRAHFLTFLQGEIQALNLELHNLGVELPGVPEIGQGQAITKGQDR